MHPQLTTQNFPYAKVRYHCSCKKVSHITYRYFDEMPPDRCPNGQRLVRDSKYVDVDALEAQKALGMR